VFARAGLSELSGAALSILAAGLLAASVTSGLGLGVGAALCLALMTKVLSMLAAASLIPALAAALSPGLMKTRDAVATVPTIASAA